MYKNEPPAKPNNTPSRKTLLKHVQTTPKVIPIGPINENPSTTNQYSSSAKPRARVAGNLCTLTATPKRKRAAVWVCKPTASPSSTPWILNPTKSTKPFILSSSKGLLCPKTSLSTKSKTTNPKQAKAFPSGYSQVKYPLASGSISSKHIPKKIPPAKQFPIPECLLQDFLSSSYKQIGRVPPNTETTNETTANKTFSASNSIIN